MLSQVIEFPGIGRFTREWLEEDAGRAQELLEKARGSYPKCLCRSPGLPLYIAKRTKLHLARFPNTGPKHAAHCPEYEADASSCGRGLYVKEAIVERSDGSVSVALDVPFLIRSGGGQAPSAPPSASEPKAQRDKVGLRGLLALLLEHAGFNRWVPGMLGRRHYRQLYKFLTETSHHIIVRRDPLSKHMYMPEPYKKEEAHAIELRRQQAFRERVRTEKGAPQRLLVVAQVRGVAESEYGQGLRFANLPDQFVVWLSRDALGRLRRQIEFACVEWPSLNPQFHVLVALTMHRTPSGHWTADDIAGLVTTTEYLPVTSLHEALVIRRLIEENRSFYKPLAYDGDVSRYSSALLTDAKEDAIPIEIISGNATEAAARRMRVDEYEAQGKPCWVWIPTDQEALSAFPPKRTASSLEVRATDLPAQQTTWPQQLSHEAEPSSR